MGQMHERNTHDDRENGDRRNDVIRKVINRVFWNEITQKTFFKFRMGFRGVEDDFYFRKEIVEKKDCEKNKCPNENKKDPPSAE